MSQHEVAPTEDPTWAALRIIIEQAQSGQRIDYKALEKDSAAHTALLASQLFLENDRTAAIVAGSNLEKELESAIKSRLIQHEKFVDQCFKPDDLIGSYGKKMRFGMLLGLYDEDFRADLKAVGDIRNAFAHKIEVTTFARDPIRSFCMNLRIFKTNIRKLPEIHNAPEPNLLYSTFSFVGGGYDKIANDPKQRFIHSIDLMAGHLRRLANSPQHPNAFGASAHKPEDGISSTAIAEVRE